MSALLNLQKVWEAEFKAHNLGVGRKIENGLPVKHFLPKVRNCNSAAQNPTEPPQGVEL